MKKNSYGLISALNESFIEDIKEKRAKTLKEADNKTYVGKYAEVIEDILDVEGAIEIPKGTIVYIESIDSNQGGFGKDYVNISIQNSNGNWNYYTTINSKDLKLLDLKESQNLKESVFEIDYAPDDVDLSSEESIIQSVKEWLGPLSKTVDVHVEEVHGPGGGWPLVRLSGDKEEIAKFLYKNYNSGEDSIQDTLDLYLIESDNRTYKDRDEAEYYRNKELYAHSCLARHKEAMNKAAKACKEKGIKLDEAISENEDLPEVRWDNYEDYDDDEIKKINRYLENPNLIAIKHEGNKEDGYSVAVKDNNTGLIFWIDYTDDGRDIVGEFNQYIFYPSNSKDKIKQAMQTAYTDDWSFFMDADEAGMKYLRDNGLIAETDNRTIFESSLNESQKLNETGEWDDSDEDMQAWLEDLKLQAEEIARNIDGEVKIVKGFDAYQGPYAIISTPKHGDIELWYDQEDDTGRSFNAKVAHVGWLNGSVGDISLWLNQDKIPEEFIINESIESENIPRWRRLVMNMAEDDYKSGQIMDPDDINEFKKLLKDSNINLSNNEVKFAYNFYFDCIEELRDEANLNEAEDLCNKQVLNEDSNEEAYNKLMSGDEVYFRNEEGFPLLGRYANNYPNPEDYDEGYTIGWNRGEDEAFDQEQDRKYEEAKKASEEGEVWEFVEVFEDTLEPTNSVYAYAYGLDELKNILNTLRPVKVKKSLDESEIDDAIEDSKAKGLYSEEEKPTKRITKLIDKSKMNEEDLIQVNAVQTEPDYVITDVTELEDTTPGDIQSPDIDAMLTMIQESIKDVYGPDSIKIHIHSSNLIENGSFALVDIQTPEILKEFEKINSKDTAVGKSLILENKSHGLFEFRVNNTTGTTRYIKRTRKPAQAIYEWLETEFLAEAKKAKEEEELIHKRKELEDTINQFLSNNKDLQLAIETIKMYIDAVGKEGKEQIQDMIEKVIVEFPVGISTTDDSLKFDSREDVIEIIFGKQWIKEEPKEVEPSVPGGDVIKESEASVEELWKYIDSKPNLKYIKDIKDNPQEVSNMLNIEAKKDKELYRLLHKSTKLNESYQQFNIGEIEVVYNPETQEVMYSIGADDTHDKKINLTKVPSVETPYNTETIIKNYIERQYGEIPEEIENKEETQEDLPLPTEEVVTDEVIEEDAGEELENPIEQDADIPQEDQEAIEDSKSETGSAKFQKIKPNSGVSVEDIREAAKEGTVQADSSYIVVEERELSDEEFNNFAEDLSQNEDFFVGITPIDRKNYAFNVIKITNQNSTFDILADPVGYNYRKVYCNS